MPNDLLSLMTDERANAPDLTGRIKQQLTKEPPAATNTLFGETDTPGRVVRAVGDMFLPSTNTAAAGMAGAMAAPVLRLAPLLSRVPTGLLRLFGSTAGADAESELVEGRPPGAALQSAV